MPRLIRFMIVQLLLGIALGLVFLTGLCAADVGGLGRLVARHDVPPTLLLAAAVSALGPFALCFMATGFAFHRWDD